MKTRWRGGFSVLELLVVIGIILVLLALILPSFINSDKPKILQTHLQLADIAAAAEGYAEFFLQYPPDTGKFSTGENPDFVSDPDSIYKYLGRKVTDASGKSHDAFLTIKPEFLKGPNGQTYVDRWGTPFQFDAVHTVTDLPTGEIKRLGEPYPPGTAALDANKSHLPKIWSYGPDKKDATGSNQISGKGTAPADADNICSWATE